MSYQYSYLIGCLILLVVWSILFLNRKNTRKEMLTMSLLFGFLGVIVTLIYLRDWWNPLTITNTRVGIEDFIFGFSVAGIAAVIYSIIFNKKVRIKKTKKNKKLKNNLRFFLLILIGLIIFLSGFFIFKFHSFKSAIVSALVVLFLIWTQRKDLILNSFLSGILLVMISLPAYLIPELVTPGWINSAWYFQNLSGITIFRIPLEDLSWFFLTGAFIGPLYEYWQEGKLINRK